jgi:hypothetical protein
MRPRRETPDRAGFSQGHFLLYYNQSRPGRCGVSPRVPDEDVLEFERRRVGSPPIAPAG